MCAFLPPLAPLAAPRPRRLRLESRVVSGSEAGEELGFLRERSDRVRPGDAMERSVVFFFGGILVTGPRCTRKEEWRELETGSLYMWMRDQ